MGYQHEDFVVNINTIVQNLIDKFLEIERGIKHKNIMFLYGDDFKYEDNHYFLNIDYLIKELLNTINNKYIKHTSPVGEGVIKFKNL